MRRLPECRGLRYTSILAGFVATAVIVPLAIPARTPALVTAFASVAPPVTSNAATHALVRPTPRRYQLLGTPRPSRLPANHRVPSHRFVSIHHRAAHAVRRLAR